MVARLLGFSSTGAGALLFAGGLLDPNRQRGVALMVAGGGLVVAGGGSLLGGALSGVSRKSGGAGGVAARILVGGPEEGAETLRTFTPEDEGFILGKPKMVQRVAGKITVPGEGKTLNRLLFSSIFIMRAMVENQSTKRQSGEVSMWAREEGVIGGFGSTADERVTAPHVANFKPGEVRELEFAIPASRVLSWSPLMTARLQWNGITMDRVSFTRP